MTPYPTATMYRPRLSVTIAPRSRLYRRSHDRVRALRRERPTREKSAAGGSARRRSRRRSATLSRGAGLLALLLIISGRRARSAALLHQAAGLDRRRHLLRLLAVDGAVVELDHGVPRLPGELLERIAVPIPVLDDLVVDARLVQLALHTPARMPSELHPDVRAPVELDRHGHTLCSPSARTQPAPARACALPRRRARRSPSP